MRFLFFSLFSPFILISVGCSSSFDRFETAGNDSGGFSAPDAPASPSPSTGPEQKSWPSFDWDGEHPDTTLWNQWTFEAIENSLGSLDQSEPSDRKIFCPNYDNLGSDEKKFFWISLLAAMSRFESGFRPEVEFQESFRDNNGAFIISRGLLQLSIESSLGYGCPLTDANELHDPKANLECSVKIMDRWVGRDGSIAGFRDGQWRGGARYWSVLRKESRLSRIQEATAKSEFCRISNS